MIEQNNSTMRNLRNQNQYISNQYKIIQGAYFPENYQTQEQSSTQILNNNNFSMDSNRKGYNNQHQRQSMQHKVISNEEGLKIESKYSRKQDKNSMQVNNGNRGDFTKFKIQNQPGFNQENYRQLTENSQGTGMTIQCRLIPEFFKTFFLEKIEVDGLQESTVNKKQLLALYVKWRLEKIPNEQKLKLVGIQLNISGYIRNHLSKQCQTLRYCYSGMKFKTLDCIVDLMHINLKEHQKVQNKKKSGKTPKSLIKQQHKYIFNSEQCEPNDQNIVSDS